MTSWFKFFIVFYIFVYLLLFGYEQYRLTKAHNLNVVNSIRICEQEYSNYRPYKIDCTAAVKREAIFDQGFH